MKRLTLIMSILSLAVVVLAILPEQQVSAALFDGSSKSACEGVTLGGPGAKCDPNSSNKIDNILELAIGAFSLLVGVAAVIMIIIGGLKYITSQGDSNGINSAKNTILYAIIGLVIVALAQLIVRFTLNRTNKAVGRLNDCTSQKVCEV